VLDEVFGAERLQLGGTGHRRGDAVAREQTAPRRGRL